MDKNHGASWGQGPSHSGGEARDIFAAQVVDNFRQKDEIEDPVWPLPRRKHLLETHARQVSASTPRLGERRLSCVDREKGVAAGGKQAGQHADRASDL